jgi:hypothetical protein
MIYCSDRGAARREPSASRKLWNDDAKQVRHSLRDMNTNNFVTLLSNYRHLDLLSLLCEKRGPKEASERAALGGRTRRDRAKQIIKKERHHRRRANKLETPGDFSPPCDAEGAHHRTCIGYGERARGEEDGGKSLTSNNFERSPS